MKHEGDVRTMIESLRDSELYGPYCMWVLVGEEWIRLDENTTDEEKKAVLESWVGDDFAK